ncbi:TonB-dependent receptor plug domain-containing protein [Parvularcula oceani]|uniref:TonB-dependent receptor plug domain-containing protein n=1 Tax=Parvularcula oceani TaxID=1247963 RepID=UPI00055EF2C4|nr:TonB-dependent receptor [Parvularcula oceani]
MFDNRHRSYRKFLWASTVIVPLFAAGSAGAQEVDDSEGVLDTGQDTIVVTGSRLPSQNMIATSPVTSVGAGEIDARGTIRAEDLLNTLPQVSPSEGSGRANEGTGTATVDLRGLGPERTLVLVNDRRLPYGSPIYAPADLNQIPTQLVERVDVLTGGATAVYGADAVAGVVNFIMVDDFEGFEINTQLSAYQTGNNEGSLEDVLNQFDQPVPGSKFDGEAIDASVVFGVNADNGRGNVTTYFNYRKQEEILQGDRITSACALGLQDGGNAFSCGGSGTTFPTHFIDGETYNVIIDEQTGNLRPFEFPQDTYNYAPLNHLIRPGERFALGAFAHYEITDEIEAYVDLMFMDDTTTAQIAPTGSFGQQTLNCDNPFFNDSLRQGLCVNRGVDPDAENPEDRLTTLVVQRRNVEGGGRQNTINHQSFRANGGFRGQLDEAWSYDVFGQYAQVSYSDNSSNFFNNDRVGNALIVRIDPATGEPACQVAIDGTDPECVPWNIFQADGVTDAALDYIQAPGLRVGTVEQIIVGGFVTGELGDYGIKFPGATDGVGLVLGAEYREESLSQTNDFLTRTGAFGTPRADVEGSIEVYELYTEAQVPIVQDAPYADELAITGAYRFSDYYETTGTQHTYAAGISYAPVPDYRFRAQYQRATRSPNPIELFSPNSRFELTLPVLTNGNSDPCAGTDPAASLDACIRTGVTPEQYGNVPNNPANQYNRLIGGNPDLEVETSDTFTVGLIATPSFADGLTVSIDYYNIDVDDFISTVPGELALNNCLETGDEFFCGLINRDPADGNLFLGDNSFITGTTVNTGSLSTSGVDVAADYTFDFGSSGSLRIDYLATFLSSLEKVPLPGEDAFECAGYYSATNAGCGTPNPDYRHWLPVRWIAPSGDFSTQLTWRHFGSADLLADNPAPVDATLDAVNYIDLAVQGRVNDAVDWRVGVNNVFDVTAPVTTSAGGSGGSFGNGNTFPSVYDALGRFLFVGATIKM